MKECFFNDDKAREPLETIIGSVWLAMKGRDRATPIPFGPYLAVAGWLSSCGANR